VVVNESECSICLAQAEEQPLIANLMQLYLYDFSEFEELPVSAEGLFDYPYLKFYWQEAGRFPYIFRQADTPVGFALLRIDMNPDDGTQFMEMAEFFVLRSGRRLGLGSYAAKWLWDAYPGSWQVCVMKINTGAYKFWQPLITQYTSEAYDLTTDAERFIFTFDNGRQQT